MYEKRLYRALKILEMALQLLKMKRKYAMIFNPNLVQPLLVAGLDLFTISFEGQSPLCWLDVVPYTYLNPEDQLLFHTALLSYGAHDNFSGDVHLVGNAAQ
ncbi:uncharacterized protein QC761_0006660 [Podospora bellae-mahoneyi]|uniref:Uncharacterized protein n=1 Tax=Podospora bellae-mahoneyi TaxID=2093777 RepID=A0ABR0FVL3_9PEZI|nr:hypothetical protein QC761_0006660 [Podospora bellae-mahoneyi]